MAFPAKELLDWFDRTKRDLPWRKERTAYRVWVSEVMLQQTQVKTVIPYYERWMLRFPTIQSLAQASEREVTKMWEGLGYYARARALLKGAKTIVEEFNGQFPKSKEEMAKIPGLGPYTIGAILNFAHRIKAPLVDGNVMRVIARFYAISDPIDRTATQKAIWKRVEEILPSARFDDFSEALMELGATCCQKEAQCEKCPLKNSCVAYLKGKIDELPKKARTTAITSIARTVFVIFCKNNYLLKEKNPGELMGGLFEFPYVDKALSEKEMIVYFKKNHQMELTYLKAMPNVKQSFTRYSAMLFVHLLEAKNRGEGRWVKKEELKELPFSSGHRKIVNQLLKHENTAH